MEDRPAWLIPLVLTLNISVLIINNVIKFRELRQVLSGSKVAPNVTKIVIELWVFSHLIAYPHAKGYHILGYLEFVLMTIQVSVILFATLSHQNSLSILKVGLYGLFLALIYNLALGAVSLEVHAYFVHSVTFLVGLGKVTRLRQVSKLKESGELTATSWLIGFYTVIAKFAGNLLTVRDTVLMAIPAVAGIMELIIAVASLATTSPSTGKQKTS